jgi:hypothetical protein
MRVSRWWLTPAAATAFSVAAWGCGGKPSVDTSSSEAKVTGTVKVKGKPMTSGTVTLDPSNYVREKANPRTGDIKSDGTYEVTTLVGKNTVRVTGPEITKNPGLGYANETIDVPSGGMTHDIILPPVHAPQ